MDFLYRPTHRQLTFLFSILTFIILNSPGALAFPIELNQRYNLNGAVELFDTDGISHITTLEAGSSIVFDSRGIFRTEMFFKDQANLSLSFGFDLDSFADGGEIALRPAYRLRALQIIAHLEKLDSEYAREFDIDMDGKNVPLDALLLINDLNSGKTSSTWKQVGTLNPANDLNDWPEFSFISVMKDAIFRLDTPVKHLSIFNGQFDPDGSLLGRTTFNLTVGDNANVPEPTTLLLFGSGLLGCLARRMRQ